MTVPHRLIAELCDHIELLTTEYYQGRALAQTGQGCGTVDSRVGGALLLVGESHDDVVSAMSRGALDGGGEEEVVAALQKLGRACDTLMRNPADLTGPAAGEMVAAIEEASLRLRAIHDTVPVRVAPRRERPTVGAMAARGELPPPLLHTSGVARWTWPQVLKYLESRQGRQRRSGRGRYGRQAAGGEA
jgi:hypothetical protein